MNVAATVGSVMSVLLGAGTAPCWMVLIVAGMANSSPAQEASLWRFFWAVGAGGLLCAAAAIALIVVRRLAFAAAVGAAPLGAFAVFIILAFAAS